jgi:hypothetical protein
MDTPTARRLAAFNRQADRLRRESIRLREQLAALGTSPPYVQERLEALRRALLNVRARIRVLEARAQAGPLSPAAAAKLAALQQEGVQLWETLRQVLRDDIPPDPD